MRMCAIQDKPQLSFLPFFSRQQLTKNGNLTDASVNEFINPKPIGPHRNHNFVKTNKVSEPRSKSVMRPSPDATFSTDLESPSALNTFSKRSNSVM